MRPLIKSGTWNIPGHPGTFRNIPEHRIIMIIMIKKCANLNLGLCSRDHLERSDWSRSSRNMFLFASRTTLLRNESYGRTLHRGKKLKKYMRSLIINDSLNGGGNVSTEYYPVSYRAIGSKYKVSGVTSFKRMEDPLTNGSGKSRSPCCS